MHADNVGYGRLSASRIERIAVKRQDDVLSTSLVVIEKTNNVYKGGLIVHMFSFLTVRSIVWNLSIRAGFTVLASGADSSNYKPLKMNPFVAFVNPGLFLQIVL